MQRLKLALSCLLLAAATGLVVQAILLLHAATVAARALPGTVSTELQATRADLSGQVEAARKDVLAEADGQLTAFRDVADRRLGDALARVDATLSTVEALRQDLQPTLANAQAITDHAKDASAVLFRRDALPAQLLGLTAAAKVTLGQTAETMRDIQRATPQMLTTWDEIGANVKATTQASTEASRSTAQVMANFARATKPLPTWARLGLAVAPPLAQVGASVATTLAITGQVGK